MKYYPDIHHRRSIRLKGHDYAGEGTYFVTLCTYNREYLFGNIIGGSVILNEYGIIVEKTWFDLPNHNSNIVLDEFIIMPNHVHAIIIVGAGSKPAQDCGVGTNRGSAGLEPAPTRATTLPEIVRQLKTFSAKKINIQRKTEGVAVWQRNYYEHIIRSKDELNRIRGYIKNNPINWDTDENFIGG